MQLRRSCIPLLYIVAFLSPLFSYAQEPAFEIQTIWFPPELSDFNNQYSSLNIYKKQLYLMAESRILEKGQEAKLYAVTLKELKRQVKDSSHTLAYRKIPIVGMDALVQRMLTQRQVCEGLEAMVIHGKEVYFTVETTTASDYVYLLKGKLANDKVVLDTNLMVPVWKPRDSRGEVIYNASFECMEWYQNRLFIFFEYNYFKGNNYIYSYDKDLSAGTKDSMLIDRMPYRISDLKATTKDHFVAINSFYKGGGKDTINRPDTDDVHNYQLVHDTGFHDYARLVDLHFNGERFTWQPIFTMPKIYEGFNWEGIAGYKKGFFLVNDKYTPAKPYYSVLLYLKPKIRG